MVRNRVRRVATAYDNSIDDLVKLERFAGDDPHAAEEAFSQLSERIYGFLHRYLATLVPREVDRQDVTALVLQKLYAKRSEFQVQSVGQWWAYVATTGKRCAWDHAGKHHDIALEDDLPESDLNAIGRVAEMSQFRTMLYRAADEFWLGVPKVLPESERRTRLLAAQLFFLNDAPYNEVCQIVGRPKPLQREVLDEWLSDRSVLMDLAFNYLYVDNDVLICSLFGPKSPLTLKELDVWSRNAEKESGEPPEGWTWEEVKVAIWRYRNGLLTEKIQQSCPQLTAQTIQAALDKCAARLPFERRARELQSALKRKHVAFDPLSATGLWRRLVFQYSIAHELPHKQILERTESAAAVAGFGLTAAMLNGWLSNGRLVTQLAAKNKEETFA